MIIWNGKGFLVVVFVFGCSFLGNLITNSFTGSSQYWDQHKWPFCITLLVSATLCWFVGKYLASRGAKTLIEKDTGKEIVVEPMHTLFFIQMYWWGPILLGISIIVLALESMK